MFIVLISFKYIISLSYFVIPKAKEPLQLLLLNYYRPLIRVLLLIAQLETKC